MNDTTTQIKALLDDAKKIAVAYYALTQKPLGITGEVAECEAAVKLKGVKLAEARKEGYDAVQIREGKDFHLQIKGRRIEGKKLGQVPSININKNFDAVWLVLLDENFEPTAIYEAPKIKIEEVLKKPGSKARNERNSLSVSKFIDISVKIWSPTTMA